MEMTVKRADWADLPRMLEVERGSTPTLQYLNEVSADFFDDTVGELMTCFYGDVLVGFGKLTVLFDKSVWLETLRVDPVYQGRGAGKALWAKFIEKCSALGTHAVRMYTNIDNRVSAGLAVKNGLHTALTVREGSLHLAGLEAAEREKFVRAGAEGGKAALMKIAERGAWNNFICYNRTFFEMNEATAAAFAERGNVYRCGDTTVVLGARFMEKNALHIGLVDGDAESAVKFAIGEGIARGADKVTIAYPPDREDVEAVLECLKFKPAPYEIIMMERKF